MRADLGALIVGRHCSPHQPLPVVTLDARLEDTILQGLRDPSSGEPVIEPELARNIGERVAQICADRKPGECQPALIVQPGSRRAMAALLRLRAPTCLVLAISELPQSQPIEVLAVVGDEGPPQLAEPAEFKSIESIAA